MKANRNSLWDVDKRAQVGIGTMIVFIATILVAATAAAVLIDTSGKLQERSSSTGNEATKQVASNLLVQGVTGERVATTDDIQFLNITVTLAPGAKTVDMEQLKIQIADGSELRTFSYNAAEQTGSNTFQLNFDRDADTSANVMTAGDLVDIQIDLEHMTSQFMFSERDEISITLIPEIGSQADASFTVPESFGADLYITLR